MGLMEAVSDAMAADGCGNLEAPHAGFALSTRREAFTMGSGGSFVAILLSVPLTAVALVGVVGVPKLQEMLSPASSHGDDEFDDGDFAPRSRSKRGSSRLDREKDQDAVAWGEESDPADEFSESLGTRKSSKSRPSLSRGGKPKPAEDSFASDLKEESDDLFSKPRGRFGSTPKETETAEMYSTEPFKQQSPVVRAEHVSPASTPRATGRSDFASSLEKLRSMGIDRFHLEPGLAAGQYLFVCQVEGTGESATVHRFEAEAADPAAAVDDVMKQLAGWQAESSVTRTAGTEFRR
jgi:hypothetical protein